MQIHHLSHIDLDGYGCQLVSYEFFSKNTNVYFYNANYGKEVLIKSYTAKHSWNVKNIVA